MKLVGAREDASEDVVGRSQAVGWATSGGKQLEGGEEDEVEGEAFQTLLTESLFLSSFFLSLSL